MTLVSFGQPPKKLTVPPRRSMSNGQLPGLRHCRPLRSRYRRRGRRSGRGPGAARRRCSPVSRSVRRAPMRGGAIELRACGGRWRSRARRRRLRQAHEHQADGSQADDRDVVAGPHVGLFQAAQHAGQRFDQRRILIADVRRNLVRIALDDAGRNADVLGVGAVVEQQILAEVLQAAAAIEAVQQGAELAATTRCPT